MSWLGLLWCVGDITPVRSILRSDACRQRGEFYEVSSHVGWLMQHTFLDLHA